MECHMDFHAASGPFTLWEKGERRAWQDEVAARFRAAYKGAPDVF
jgi:hypothetical protein